MSQNSMISRVLKSRAGMAVPLVFLLLAGYEMFEWTFNRIYVPQGYSLVMRYKGPPLPFLPGGRPVASPGEFAKVDESGLPLEIGILKDMLGPGRHFCWIGWWEDQRSGSGHARSSPGQVALISSQDGKASCQAGNQFLVDGDLDQTKEKGIPAHRSTVPGLTASTTYAYNVELIKKAARPPPESRDQASGWVSTSRPAPWSRGYESDRQ
jgi:hypothetical protein